MPRIDLHVHTRRYSSCAEFLVPEELGHGMQRAKLDGVVITEHDRWWLPEEKTCLQQQLEGMRIYFGAEISASDGHVIAIGVSPSFVFHRRETIQQVARNVDEAGGCALWVHPFQEPRRWVDPPRSVHAIEIFSSVTFGARSTLAQSLAAELGVHRVAGSDAHSLDHLGTAWVEFDELPLDEQQLAQWIRQGRARPFQRQ